MEATLRLTRRAPQIEGEPESILAVYDADPKTIQARWLGSQGPVRYSLTEPFIVTVPIKRTGTARWVALYAEGLTGEAELDGEHEVIFLDELVITVRITEVTLK